MPDPAELVLPKTTTDLEPPAAVLKTTEHRGDKIRLAKIPNPAQKLGNSGMLHVSGRGNPAQREGVDDALGLLARTGNPRVLRKLDRECRARAREVRSQLDDDLLRETRRWAALEDSDGEDHPEHRKLGRVRCLQWARWWRSRWRERTEPRRSSG